FRLDVEKLMLYRDGVEVSMPPKMVKTLVVLVENGGEIISKDNLLEQVWSDTIVDESNLSQHLYHLRKVLGELPDGRPYIETLRRRGYRFNADVRATRAAKVKKPSITESIPSARNVGVERDGNVLRLVEWPPNPQQREHAASIEPQDHRSADPVRQHFPRLAVLIAITGVAVITALVVVFNFRSAAIPQAAANAEISMLRLTSGSAPEAAAISPHGDYFAYHEVGEEGPSLWLHQVGSANRIKIEKPAKGSSYGPKTFSPDGKFLFISVFEQEGTRADLYRIPSIGGPRTKVLDDVDYGISFSPDGSELVFLRDEKTAGNTSLVIADKEGKSQRTILQKNGQTRFVGSPAWSPDGKLIAFASIDPDNSTGIYVTEPSGTLPRRISNERWDNAYRIVWMPDGTGLVMIATRAGESYSTRRNQIYYLSYPSGESRRLTSDGSWHQEWSLGVSNDEAILAVPFNRSSQIWSLASNGASASAMQISRGLADGRAGLTTLADGRVGFVSRVGEDVGIWLMNADGAALRQLPTGGLPVVEELRSDLKGQYFVFSGHRDGKSQLYRFGVEREKMTQLTFGDDQPVDSTISPDGSSIIYHSQILGQPARLSKVAPDGGKVERFGDVACETPHYSPTGDRFSCIRGDDIVIVSPDGSQIKTIRILPYTRINVGAKWTPDGKGLVYIRSEKGVGNLWLQPLDGGSPKQLTDFTIGNMYNFAFSFDGTRLFVARGQQISDAVLLRNYR
ncbi:MAG TPA: winged helix-turn-helix domain-containing protein, partial [Pyrinomonadaceae bacterium]|nr:winged helix-turn-helix domain-containing protein [Pyrinomonadaceae bacterium]